MDEDRQRSAERRAHGQLGQRRPRGSEAEGTALLRHRDDRLCVVRRWGPLAIVAAEPAQHVDPRSRVPQRRSHERHRHRHIRSWLLGARRHDSAARDRGEGWRDRRGARVLLQAGRRHPLAPQCELGSADVRRDAAHAEPAVWRDSLLPSEPAAGRRDDAAGVRRGGRPRAHHLQHPAGADRGRDLSRLLAALAGFAFAADGGRDEPRQLGSALRRSAGVQPRSRKPDEHGRSDGVGRPTRSAGPAGNLHA